MVDGATDSTLPSDVDLSQSTPFEPIHHPASIDSKRKLYESDRRPFFISRSNQPPHPFLRSSRGDLLSGPPHLPSTHTHDGFDPYTRVSPLSFQLLQTGALVDPAAHPSALRLFSRSSSTCRLSHGTTLPRRLRQRSHPRTSHSRPCWSRFSSS